ncbi:MAG: hypothetical protein EON54_06310 [Alcaligenaceae bacterium]|nr:MAG: hypothetical protein EON54_06310 [Alcaligenaceae bacterium]
MAELRSIRPLTPVELTALAASVRAGAKNVPWVVSRVAAALESVARYREARSAALAQRATDAIECRSARSADIKFAFAHRRFATNYSPKFSKARGDFVERSRLRRTADRTAHCTLADWPQSAICMALLAAERGRRLSRVERRLLAAQGWIEQICERGHSGRRSSRVWLFTRLTRDGNDQLTLRLIALGM